MDWVNCPARAGLMRDTGRGIIAGVCAGIGERLSIKPGWVRLAFILLALMWHGIASIALYVILALVMPKGVGSLPERPGRSFGTGGWRDTPGPTPPPVSSIAARFAALDARLNRLEAAVTTNEFSLRQKFRDLGR
jgi:phage shock protein C